VPEPECPPGYVRTALGNCIKDPIGNQRWRLGESLRPDLPPEESHPVE